MFKRRTTALLATAAALLLTPGLASAQVVLLPGTGGYGGYGFGGPGFGYRPFSGYGGLYGPGYGGMYGPGYGGYPGYGYPGYGYPGYGGLPAAVSPYGLNTTPRVNNFTTYYSTPGWSATVDLWPRKRKTIDPATAVPAGATLDNGTTAHIDVQLPAGNATVLFDGTPTSQTGTMRQFVTPSLEEGRYSYTIEARWAGQSQRRTVSVRPGQRVLVDFTTGS